MSRDEEWMREALRLAKKAAERGEVPVGALVVRDEAIVGVGYNLRESAQDPTAHAELIAVRAAAARVLGVVANRLRDVAVFVLLT